MHMEAGIGHHRPAAGRSRAELYRLEPGIAHQFRCLTDTAHHTARNAALAHFALQAGRVALCEFLRQLRVERVEMGALGLRGHVARIREPVFPAEIFGQRRKLFGEHHSERDVAAVAGREKGRAGQPAIAGIAHARQFLAGQQERGEVGPEVVLGLLLPVGPMR